MIRKNGLNGKPKISELTTTEGDQHFEDGSESLQATIVIEFLA
jgi:hypothetical protein